VTRTVNGTGHGGEGPSLVELYKDGNAYVASDPQYDSMAITRTVEVCSK